MEIRRLGAETMPPSLSQSSRWMTLRDFFDEINRALSQFLTPAVKMIFLINVGVTIVLIISGSVAPVATNRVVLEVLAQDPRNSVFGLRIWQFLTYMFVHVDPMHLIFNMLVLWFFGPGLENRWDSRRFWQFFLITGVGAGIMHAALALLAVHQEVAPIIGASGAIYGVLLAFAIYYPDQTVLLWFVVPVKIKYLVVVLIFLVFLGTAGSGGGNVSNLTHLTGLLVAYGWMAYHHRDWDFRRWRWRGIR